MRSCNVLFLAEVGNYDVKNYVIVRVLLVHSLECNCLLKRYIETGNLGPIHEL